jgi:hypothetical protein
MPQKWESTTTKDQQPHYQYRLSKSCIEQFGLEECEKGVSVGGVNLTLNWKTLINAESKLRDFLVKNKGESGMVDLKIYYPNSEKPTMEYSK